jgi:hypothetical protein
MTDHLGFRSICIAMRPDPDSWRRCHVQIKLFDAKLSDLTRLEAEVNQWLAANPKLVTIQRDFHVYHNHTTSEERVMVALWYEPKSSF